MQEVAGMEAASFLFLGTSAEDGGAWACLEAELHHLRAMVVQPVD